MATLENCCIDKALRQVVKQKGEGDYTNDPDYRAFLEDCRRFPSNWNCENATDQEEKETPLFNPLGGGVSIIPAGKAYGGVRFTELLTGAAVLAFVTLSLPKKYGYWLPVLVLLGYTANKQGTVLRLFSDLGIGGKKQ